MTEDQFRHLFSALTGNEMGHFPWQWELYGRFASSDPPRFLDIPTGLGKTSVIAVWLAARASGARVPRRLVYVVDRRAVVDQATTVALQLRKSIETAGISDALGLEGRALPISTLRGKFIDNRQWLERPAAPAVIVGTVDMIGSRLLFEGYGVSRKMRSYHAGLLGADSLVVLDEAHLVPPFERLIEAIADGPEYRPEDEDLRTIIPPLMVLSLSATGRVVEGRSLGLGHADLKHPVVRKRLDAKKRLTVEFLDTNTTLAAELARLAWKLSDNGGSCERIITFCDKREDAALARDAVEKLAKGDQIENVPPTELFVGARRAFERDAAADWLRKHGFLAGDKTHPERPTFLFATSAGEVGVDLDADHLISDLVSWERMVQRLGRVNRRGEGDAKVIVLVRPEKEPLQALGKEPGARTKAESLLVSEYNASLARLRALERLPCKSATYDASPGAIRELNLSAARDADLRAALDAATTLPPLMPPVSRALVDAWSMTSLEKHTGRPKVEPWLRGWIEDDAPQTRIIWRKHLPVAKGKALADREIRDFFEAAPPHTAEILETESFRVAKWLRARMKAALKHAGSHRSSTPGGGYLTDDVRIAANDVAAILFPTDESSKVVTKTLAQLDEFSAETKTTKQETSLQGAMIVVDARVGGLKAGLLDEAENGLPPVADDNNSNCKS